MAIMKFNEQFYRNYNELYTMIKQCYCEVAILEAYIELQKDRPDLYNKVINSNRFFIFCQYMVCVMTNAIIKHMQI